MRSTEGTFRALRSVLASLEELPGRKALVLVSESLALEDEEGRRSPDLVGTLSQAVEAANAASVVLYVVDPGGLRADVPSWVLDRRRAGLANLARETGGLLVSETNDLTDAMRTVVEDQGGYYLVGYAAIDGSEPTAGRARHRRITVDLTRPNLRVRVRSGAYRKTP